MASRAVWKGQLRLSLVSIPVEIHAATKSGAQVSFRQIHEPSGKRVRYEKVVPGIGPVDKDEIVKGYDAGDDDYILIEPEELEAIRLETKKTFELVQFVAAREIPPLYYDRPYYVVPTDDLAQDAYRVVRDALRAADKVGLGQLTMRGKEYLAAIKPCGDGLLLETLHYADELRNADPLFSGIEDDAVDQELLEVAGTLIERKSGAFDASVFKDHYTEALRDLVAAKKRSKATRRAPVEKEGEKAAQSENVVDLMAALKQSVQSAEKGSKASKGGAKSSGRGKKAS